MTEISAPERGGRRAGELYYKGLVETLSSEAKVLKQRLEQVERENRALRASVYQLSGHKSFDLRQGLAVGQDATSASSRTDTKDPKDTGRRFRSEYTLSGHRGAVYGLAFNDSGSLLASCGFDGRLLVWNTRPGSPPYQHAALEHPAALSTCLWRGDAVAAASYDAQVLLWAPNTAPSRIAVPGPALDLAPDPADANRLYCVTTRELCAIDPRTPRLIQSWPLAATSLAVEEEGRILQGTRDGLVLAIDPATGTPQSTLQVSDRPITGLRLTKTHFPDRYLAVNCYDDVLRLYRQDADWTLLQSLTGHHNANFPVRSAFHIAEAPARPRLAADSSIVLNYQIYLATGSADSNAYVFDLSQVEDADERPPLSVLPGHTDRVYTPAFHPTAPMLATGSADFNVKLWGWAKAKKMKTPL